MQPPGGPPVNPLVSVVTTLAVPRRRPLACLRSWTESQRVEAGVELVVASDGRRPGLERRVRGALRPGDRLLRVPGADEMAQYAAAARAARGEWLLFTEPHVEALPGCLAALLEHVDRAALAGACVHTLEQPERSRVARMEARMYREEAAGWNRAGDWRTFTKRGVLVSRAAYLDAGGLDPAQGHYAETALARELHARGHAVGYAPAARIRHQNSTRLLELLGYVAAYRRHAAAAAGATPADREWTAVAPAILRDALRVALGRRRDPGWRALAGRLATLRLGLALGPRLGPWVAAGAPARRAARAWLRFHRPGQDDERTYAAYVELWRAAGDLAVATRPGAATAWGLHEPESFAGTRFRWSDAVARVDADGAGPLVVDVLDVRPLDPGDVLAYRGAERLVPCRDACTPTRLVFDGGGMPDAPVTLVCPPLPRGEGGDPRTLGLPIVAVRQCARTCTVSPDEQPASTRWGGPQVARRPA